MPKRAEPSVLAGMSIRGSACPISVGLARRVGVDGASLGDDLARDIGEADRLRLVDDEAVRRLALRPVDAPVARRRLAQHLARRRPGQPHRRGETAHRGTAAGHLHVEMVDHAAHAPAGEALQRGRQAGRRVERHAAVGVDRIERRRLDRHRIPVGAELVGDDLRQRAADALPHLGLRNRDDDAAVGADLDEAVDHRLVGRGGPVQRVRPRPDGIADRQPRDRAGADQERAPRRARPRPGRRSRRRNGGVHGVRDSLTPPPCRRRRGDALRSSQDARRAGAARRASATLPGRNRLFGGTAPPVTRRSSGVAAKPRRRTGSGARTARPAGRACASPRAAPRACGVLAACGRATPRTGSSYCARRPP